MKEAKLGMGEMGARFLEEGREWKLPDLLHAQDLVLWGGSEEDLKPMTGRFDQVCRGKDLKIYNDKAR